MKNVTFDIRQLSETDNVLQYSQNISALLANHSIERELQHLHQHNPDHRITFLEQRIAALEHGKEAMTIASLKIARELLIWFLTSDGDNIININSHLLPEEVALSSRKEIEVRNAPNDKPATLETLIDEKTKFIYMESISDHTLNIPDFLKIIRVANKYEIPVIVDNTNGWAGTFVQPLKHGAHLVIESTEEWFTQHSEKFDSVIVDNNSYNWLNGKFPYLNTVVKDLFTDHEEALSIIHILRKSNNLHVSQIPVQKNSLSLIREIQNISTDAVHFSQSAKDIAAALRITKGIKKLLYTGDPLFESYTKALTYFRNGFGNIIAFELQHEHDQDAFANTLKKNKPTDYKYFHNQETGVHYLYIKSHTPEIVIDHVLHALKEAEEIYHSYILKKIAPEFIYNMF